MPLPEWADAAERQYRRLNLDRWPRVLATCLAFLMASFFIDILATVVAFAVYLCSEILADPLMGKFAARPSRLRSNLYLLISFGGTTAYSLLVALLWFSGDPAVRIAAIGYLCGGFINTVAVNTVFLPMAISKAIPLSVVAMLMPVTIMNDNGFSAESLLAFFTSLVLTGYVARLGYDIHKTEASLSAARRANEELALAKSRFLAIMSHEIRTPLNTIMGIAQMVDGRLQQAGARIPEQSSMLLAEAAVALQATVEDAMAVAEQTDIFVPERVTLVPLAQCLRVAVARVQSEAQERGVDLTLRLFEGLPELARFDPVLMRKAVIGVLQHMVQASQIGEAEVRLTVQALDRVQPSGGSGAFTLSLCFTASGPLRDDVDPLVLKTALTAAEWIKGMIEVKHADRPGAEILLRIPLETPLDLPATIRPDGVAPEPDKAPAKANPRITNVLVVDDISSNRFIIAHLLRHEGMRVVEAPSGQAALEILRHARFDVVLLDMNMPKMSGPETLSAIRNSREQWSDIPVIAVTADALDSQRSTYGPLGFGGFIAKPVDLNQMLAEIRGLLPLA